MVTGLAFGTLAQEVSGMVVSILISIMENMSAESLFAGISFSLSRRGLGRRIQQAIQRAFERWVRDVNDPDLVDTLGQITHFQRDEAVIRVLAAEAMAPGPAGGRISALAARLHELMPAISPSRCAHAAEVLLVDLHDEAATIGPLQRQIERAGVRRVEQQLSLLLPLPPYQPELRETILQRADEIQRELGHGYVTAAHLLYALVTIPERFGQVASSVLLNHCSAVDIRAALQRRIKPHRDVAGEATNSATDALGEAQRIAQQRGARQTRSGHVLEALAQEATKHPSGSVAAVFAALELTPTAIQAEATRREQAWEKQLISELQSDSGA